MTTTTNYGLTLLEVGQKEKEVTINTNFSTLDNVPKYLGDLATNPVTTTLPIGSRYYNTGSSQFGTLRSKGPDVWIIG